MALSKIQPASIDLTANYAFTGTNSVAGLEYAEKKLATVTASSSGTLSFTSDIDSTYNIYKFRFIEIHPSHDGNVDFSFQCSTDGGSNYNTNITSNFFDAYHYENDSSAAVRYLTSRDLANSTSFQPLSVNTAVADADQHVSGELFLFDPSSTTFVKNFLSTTQTASDGGSDDFSDNAYIGGYFNTTSAINAIQFKFPSGNIDSGTIEMYGIN
jgi:hypothetical protein